jgi:hypothetical protein
MCGECWDEAKRYAEDRALEDKLAMLRLNSADALLRRLGGTP